ncbi:MAG: hypothetical protein ACRECF_03650 [Methyloceanibacter sp.]
MRLLLWAVAISAIFTVLAESVSAQTSVRPYVRKDGTYVAPHFRSNPNNTTLDNWSTKGNANPFTGERGTVDPLGSSNNYGLKSWGNSGGSSRFDD